MPPARAAKRSYSRHYHRPQNLYRKTGTTEITAAQWAWNNDGTPLWLRRGNDIDTTYEYDSVE
ncbi:MAG: hypothetical protein JW909_03475 [Planctomycetes bacterium]|nr:hypothetical protein [Planctomycetota bacterium]